MCVAEVGKGDVAEGCRKYSVWSQMGEGEVAAASELFWRRSERNVRNLVARGF